MTFSIIQVSKFIKLVCIVGGSVISAPVASGSPVACSNRSKAELHSRWASYHADQTAIIHESFFLVPEFQQSITTSMGDEVNNCMASTNVMDLVNLRSHCPWYHIMSYDPDRYPDQLVEARSSCTEPFGFGSGCTALNYPIPVLQKTRRCDEEGYYEYEQTWHNLIVGYTSIVTGSTS